jgi:tetratricopeptide (TPR) repeat protein
VSARRCAAAAALLLALVAGLSPAAAQPGGFPAELPPDTPVEGSVERDALIEFQRDPVHNAAALLRLGHGSARSLPVVILLAAADVHMRAGRSRSAARFFREVVRRDPGPPWTAFAQLGLGWSDLARGDLAAAERRYASVDTPADVAAIAAVMRGWLAAASGRHGEAIAALDHLAAHARSGNVREVALLGSGYARYWDGRVDEAAATLDRLEIVAPASPLADDARYAAAWARLQIPGERAEAMSQLAQLAQGGGDADVARARIELRPRAVLRAGERRSSDVSGFAPPDVRLVAMVDGDGRALARAALELLERRRQADVDRRDAAEIAARTSAAAVVPGDAATETRPAAVLAPASATATGSIRGGALVAIALVALALAALAAAHRRGSRPGKPG